MVSYALSLMALALLVWLWLQALDMRATAMAGARRACTEAQVQLLDESVSLSRLDLRGRGPGGRLRWWYDFDFSLHGQDRYRGSVAVAGWRVQTVRLDHPGGTLWLAGARGGPGQPPG